MSYPANGNRVAAFQWTLASRKASAFLKVISRHLIIKREKALKAIYLADRITEKKRTFVNGMRGSYVPQEEWDMREKLLTQVRDNDVSIEQIIMAAEKAEKK